MGSVVISVDAELAWGFHDLPEPPRRRIEAARPAWSRLLEAFETFSVPATWAVVGHLFLEECDGAHQAHPGSPGWLRERWFERDPGGRAEEHDAWFAPDLVRAIQEARPAHEIACHGFSHVEFGDPATTRELAVAEVEASIEAAASMDVSLHSFVFPRNNVGHRDVLASYGFTSYRGTRPGRWFDALPTPRAGKLLDATVVRSTPPLVSPEIDEHELVDLPASLDLFGFEGTVRSAIEPVFGDPVVRQARAGIDRAVDGEGVFHLWLHPNNLLDERDFDRLDAVLSYVAERHERTALAVETMQTVSERALDDSHPPRTTPR